MLPRSKTPRQGSKRLGRVLKHRRKVKASQRLGARARRLLDAHSAAMRLAVRRGVIAGMCSTAILKNRTVFRRSFGFADIERNQKFTHKSICRIYCSSKPYVHMAAMILSDANILDLDDPVSKYIPSLRKPTVQAKGSASPRLASRAMLVKHLLTHSAGFSYGIDFNFPPNKVQARYSKVTAGVESGRLKSLSAFVDALAKVPLCFEPGKRYEYGYSTDVLGRVLEVAEGKPLDQVLQDRLFKPLGMNDTAFEVPVRKVGRLAALYGNAKTWAHLNGKRRADAPAARPKNLHRLDGGAPRASAWAPGRVRVLSGGGLVGHNRGGLTSTAQDTEAFVRMLLDRGVARDGTRVVSERTLARCERNMLVGPLKAAGTHWALLGDLVGNERGGTSLQQGGAAGNYWLLDRRRQLAVIVFMQQVDGEDWGDLGFDTRHADLEVVMRTIVDAARRA